MRPSLSSSQLGLLCPPFPPSHANSRSPGQTLTVFTPKAPSLSAASSAASLLSGNIRKGKRVIRNPSSAGSKKNHSRHQVPLLKKQHSPTMNKIRSSKVCGLVGIAPPPLFPQSNSLSCQIKVRNLHQTHQLKTLESGLRFTTPKGQKSNQSFGNATLIYTQSNNTLSKKIQKKQRKKFLSYTNNSGQIRETEQERKSPNLSPKHLREVLRCSASTLYSPMSVTSFSETKEKRVGGVRRGVQVRKIGKDQQSVKELICRPPDYSQNKEEDGQEFKIQTEKRAEAMHQNYSHFNSTQQNASSAHGTSHNYVNVTGYPHNYGGQMGSHSNQRSKRSSSKHVKPVVNNFVESGKQPTRKSSLSSTKKPNVSGSASKGNASVFVGKRNSNLATQSTELIDRSAFSNSGHKKRTDSELIYQYMKVKDDGTNVSQSMPYFQIDQQGEQGANCLATSHQKAASHGPQTPGGSKFAHNMHMESSSKKQHHELANSTVGSLQDFTRTLQKPLHGTSGSGKHNAYIYSGSSGDFSGGSRKQTRAKSNLAHYIKNSHMVHGTSPSAFEESSPTESKELHFTGVQDIKHNSTHDGGRYHTMSSHTHYPQRMELTLKHYQSSAQDDMNGTKGQKGLRDSQHRPTPGELMNRALASKTAQDVVPHSSIGAGSRTHSQNSGYTSQKQSFLSGSRKSSSKGVGDDLELTLELAKKLDAEMQAQLNVLADREPSHVMTDNKFNIYRQTFTLLCEQNNFFSLLLGQLKAAYEEKINQVFSQKYQAKFFNSSPSAYEILHDELKETKHTLHQEHQDKQALSKRLEEMAKEIQRLHTYCDAQEGYIKDLKEQNGSYKHQLQQAKQSLQELARDGCSTDLLGELEQVYQKYNQQQQLLKRYKSELQRTQHQEMVYFNLLKRESDMGAQAAAVYPQSTASNTISYGSPNRHSRQGIGQSPNLRSNRKKEFRTHHGLESSYQKHQVKKDGQNRASSAMRMEEVLLNSSLQQIGPASRKYSHSPQPAKNSGGYRRKVKIPKLDLSKLRGGAVGASQKAKEMKAMKVSVKKAHSPSHTIKIPTKEQLELEREIEVAKQQMNHYLNNHSFTVSELNKSYDSKASLGINLKRASINDIPSKESFFKETMKKMRPKGRSPQREKYNRNTLQDFSDLNLREDIQNRELHSSFDSNSRVSGNSLKPKVPKINIGAIRKGSVDRIVEQQQQQVKGATALKPKIPNLKGKIHSMKQNEIQNEIKNLKLEAPKNFHQEFMSNVEDFSESWREQALQMDKRVNRPL